MKTLEDKVKFYITQLEEKQNLDFEIVYDYNLKFGHYKQILNTPVGEIFYIIDYKKNILTFNFLLNGL